MDTAGPPAWHRQIRLIMYVGIGLVLVGLVVVYLGYNGAATNPVVEAQIPFVISGGIFGGALVLLGGLALALAAFLRSQADLREEISEMRAGFESLREIMALRAMRPEGAAGSNGLVIVPKGGSSFHKAGCRIAERAKDTNPLPRPEAVQTGLMPCRVCKP